MCAKLFLKTAAVLGWAVLSKAYLFGFRACFFRSRIARFSCRFQPCSAFSFVLCRLCYLLFQVVTSGTPSPNSKQFCGAWTCQVSCTSLPVCNQPHFKPATGALRTTSPPPPPGTIRAVREDELERSLREEIPEVLELAPRRCSAHLGWGLFVGVMGLGLVVCGFGCGNTVSCSNGWSRHSFLQVFSGAGNQVNNQQI